MVDLELYEADALLGSLPSPSSTPGWGNDTNPINPSIAMSVLQWLLSDMISRNLVDLLNDANRDSTFDNVVEERGYSLVLGKLFS